MCLIATPWTDPWLWISVLEVCVGLGFVIFVHELGHFAVAKLCGVKCEKFYLGFDIAGWKLCKFTWGETEYGIGILPLGGYVKMLGQEDNPARLREEIERAKRNQAGDQAPEPDSEDDAKQAQPAESERPQGDEIDVKAAEQALFDPRSYLAQSVPRRMAIISAGVVMNLIFAFVMAIFAFEMGVPRRPCRVGGLMPGQAAWQNDIRIGDQIVEIDGKRIDNFRDMQEAVSLSDNVKRGLLFMVRRPGREEPLRFTVKPDSSGLLPMIGIFSSPNTSLQRRKDELVAGPGSAADKSEPGFQPGDTIVEIDGQSIDSYAQLQAYLALHRDETIRVTLQRAAGAESEPPESADSAGGVTAGGVTVEQVTIQVAPNPMRRLGLVMKMGPISAIRAGSPAAEAGIEPGDRVSKIDLSPPADRRQPPNLESAGDPLTLPDRLRRRAGNQIALLLEGDDQPKYIRLGPVDRYEVPADDDNPISVPELGIAYWVLNQVDHPVKDAPNRAASVPAGAEIVSVKLLAPKEQSPHERKLKQLSEVPISFGDKRRNWPLVIAVIQDLLPATEVEITWAKAGKEETTRLKPYEEKDWPNPARGFLYEPDKFIQRGEGLGDSTRLAAKETVHATLVVYHTLQKLSTRQVSAKALGGPISIFKWLKRAAEQSTPELFITLTLLSANLAVLNFLPIPLLDGGHMVFLTWEAVRGKPANERVQLALTYVGLALILTLMAWVIALDIGLISRH